jgi:hypothetical protein
MKPVHSLYPFQLSYINVFNLLRGRRGRDHMVVGFKTIYAIGAYHR